MIKHVQTEQLNETSINVNFGVNAPVFGIVQSPLPFRGGGKGVGPLGVAQTYMPHPNPSPEGEGLCGTLS